MRQVSNLLFFCSKKALCVFHLLSTCIVLFYDFLIVDAAFRSLMSFFTFSIHLCHCALLHEKCAAVTGEVLNILIFAAPLHLAPLSVNEF